MEFELLRNGKTTIRLIPGDEVEAAFVGDILKSVEKGMTAEITADSKDGRTVMQISIGKSQGTLRGL